jgi:hypothetical protein
LCDQSRQSPLSAKNKTVTALVCQALRIRLAPIVLKFGLCKARTAG